jgi:GNAT superfamily N-acetyltransferase
MIVRAATTADAPAIASLCAQLGYPTGADDILRRLARLDASQHAVLVAEAGAVVVGWLHVALTFALEYEPCAEILGLVVDEHVRSRGAGAALVTAAEDWASAQAVAEVRVRSRDSRERAHRFYLRCGYTVWKQQVVFRKMLPLATADIAR